MRSMKGRVLLASLALALFACGGGSDEPGVSARDREAGAQIHPRLLAEFGGRYEGGEAAYLARLGERVAGVAGLPGQCTFTLVNSDVVNAFAVPGCYIYVTRGLMALVNSEAELVSVLAHEMGHIVGRHSQRQERSALWRRLGVLAVGFVTESERLTRIAGGAADLFGLRYSRKQEYEADDLGLSYLRQAGYDPLASADMLDALSRQEQFLARTRGRDEASSVPEWARTHPLTGNRIERARQAALATGQADRLPEREEAFLREVDGLLFGDDPAQGFVSGRRFAHPLMRIGFDAPVGFFLTNSPQAILIEGPDGIRGEFAGGRLGPGGLDDYADALLSNLLGRHRAEIREARRADVNGVPAFFLDVAIATPDGEAALALAAYQGPGDAAYHFLVIGPPGQAAMPAIDALFRSFRLLSPADVAMLRPRRVAVVRAGAGDSAETLARRMASDAPLDHFRLLNALGPGGDVRPGQKVKIVSY
jgi:predicted Zn-dependent protease